MRLLHIGLNGGDGHLGCRLGNGFDGGDGYFGHCLHRFGRYLVVLLLVRLGSLRRIRHDDLDRVV